jgi:23S rRNA (guanosine2251-2'-O)-methyltransferase
MTQEILHGFHPVGEALRAGRRRVEAILVSDRRGDRRLEALIAEAETRQIPVRRLPQAELTNLAGPHHQGVAARVGPLAVLDLDGLCSALGDGTCPPWILVLDGVVDPQNLGALVRTAVCADMGAVVLPKDRSARPGPAVSRASAGALEHVRLAVVPNIVAALQALKPLGLWVAGLDRNEGRPLFASDLSGPLAIVVGAEGKGIRPLVRRHCDFLVAVPQTGPIDSLNASVAGAVVIYESWRQRHPASGMPNEVGKPSGSIG